MCVSLVSDCRLLFFHRLLLFSYCDGIKFVPDFEKPSQPNAFARLAKTKTLRLAANFAELLFVTGTRGGSTSFGLLHNDPVDVGQT